MKELFRKFLQKNMTFVSSLSYVGSSILFPRFNYMIFPALLNIIEGNKYKILFVDDLKDTFDWKHLAEEEIKGKNFLNKFFNAVDKAENFLSKNKVEYFVVDRFTRNNLNLHAFLCVANRMGIKTVYLDHGETGSIHPNIPFDRLLNWDYIYVTNTDMKRYYLEEMKKYNIYKEVREWSRTKTIVKNRNKELILFAPQFIEADRFDQLFPQTLQYKHREKLLYAFDNIVEKYKIRVVWKTHKPGNLLYDPIKDLAKKIKVDYIDGNGFEFYLSKAKMFVADCISTTAYDAINNNVPTLILRYRRAAETRESILESFGESIFIYDTIENAIVRLEVFILDCIAGDEKLYLHEIEYNPEKFPWEEVNEYRR